MKAVVEVDDCSQSHFSRWLSVPALNVFLLPRLYRRRLKESDDLSFGNDVYTVTFDSKEEFPLFGCKYDFHLEGVVDCPEFLVNFEMMKILAKEQGLQLVKCWTFEEFYSEYQNEDEGSFLLTKMSALETYPASGRFQLSGKEEDYAHAQGSHEKTGRPVVS